MNPSHPSGREKEIFEQAIDLPSTEARLGYVQGACSGDADLLARVQTLLRAHEATGGFLPDNPGGTSDPTVNHAMSESPEKPGTIIGRYKLLEKVGEGGFGSVYMAEQEVPVRRRVALKVIKLGMDTKEVVARFEAERQALAMMDHPNIAKVLDAGATETGRPYFVMELVKGVPITTYCDQRQLSTPARLELFILVCQAVQHAHQKGIIHRDLKPSNILVTEQDDRPLPKVIDFGVARATQARLTEKTMFTQFHQMVGTPAYMSPEQTGLANLDIDTRSDIYSLGVLLYELLTGCTPFDPSKLLEAGYEGIMRIIREVEPPKPSTRLSSLSVQELTALGGRRQEEPRRLGRLVQGDLDWIVMKALEKDRSRRYETATNLAQDLQRHLGNEPVVARPPSAAYLLQKLVRRHRVACAAGTVILASLIVGLGISVWAYSNEKAARQFAVESTVNLRKASETNQKIMIRAADNQRRADASDHQAAIDAAKSAYALAAMQAVVARQGATTAPAAAATALVPTTDRLLGDTTIPPEAKWELCELFGDLYLEGGDFGHAEALFRAAVTLRRATQGDGHPALLPVMRKLIETLQRQGKDREAHQLQIEAGHASSAYLRSDQWRKQLQAEAAKLQATGRYAEAEAKLQAASEVARVNRPDRYRPLDDLGRLAWLRFDAGDLAGTRELALHWLAAEKSGRNWTEAGPFGFFIWVGTPDVVSPYDAHTLLGLIALREGDAGTARDHLLKSATGVTQRTELDWRKLQLAAALAARGDIDMVRRFLDRIRQPYVGDYEARNPENTFSQRTTFDFAAIGQLHARQLADWKLDLSAGRIPGEWAAMRDTQSSRPPFVGPPLPAVASLSLPPVKTTASLWRPLLPFGFLMLGWCATAVIPRFKITGLLPPAAAWWLLAFCVFRALECGRFTAMLVGDGYVPRMFSGLLVSFFSWIILWRFVRALLPSACSRGETRFMNALAGTGVVLTVALLLSGYVDSGYVGAGTTIIAVLLLTLFTFGLSVAVCITAGKRLWTWQQTVALDPRRRLCLKLAVPLLFAHGFISLFVGEIHRNPPAISEPIFWVHALLPWLLAAGFLHREHTGQLMPR